MVGQNNRVACPECGVVHEVEVKGGNMNNSFNTSRQTDDECSVCGAELSLEQTGIL